MVVSRGIFFTPPLVPFALHAHTVHAVQSFGSFAAVETMFWMLYFT